MIDIDIDATKEDVAYFVEVLNRNADPIRYLTLVNLHLVGFHASIDSGLCLYPSDSHELTKEEKNIIEDIIREETTFTNAYVSHIIYANGNCRDCIVYTDNPREPDDAGNVFLVVS